MGWAGPGKRYYYQKMRRGDRVISEYVGTGILAELAAQCEWISRMAEQKQRQEQERVLTALHKEDEETQQIIDLINAIAMAFLLVNGFHTHHGQWRRYKYDG